MLGLTVRYKPASDSSHVHANPSAICRSDGPRLPQMKNFSIEL